MTNQLVICLLKNTNSSIHLLIFYITCLLSQMIGLFGFLFCQDVANRTALYSFLVNPHWWYWFGHRSWLSVVGISVRIILQNFLDRCYFQVKLLSSDYVWAVMLKQCYFTLFHWCSYWIAWSNVFVPINNHSARGDRFTWNICHSQGKLKFVSIISYWNYYVISWMAR